jgi:hypothetical protein
MKKSTTTILLLVLAFICNAQKNTDTVRDVCIPYPVIKSIQTDLLIGDSAKALLSVTSTESALLKRQIFDQMNAIDLYKSSENNLKIQIKNLNEQVNMHKGAYGALENNFNSLSKQYRKKRIKNTIFEIVLVTGVGVLTGQMLHYRDLYIKKGM